MLTFGVDEIWPVLPHGITCFGDGTLDGLGFVMYGELSLQKLRVCCQYLYEAPTVICSSHSLKLFFDNISDVRSSTSR